LKRISPRIPDVQIAGSVRKQAAAGVFLKSRYAGLAM
jgi:hypothetical protein